MMDKKENTLACTTSDRGMGGRVGQEREERKEMNAYWD